MKNLLAAFCLLLAPSVTVAETDQQDLIDKLQNSISVSALPPGGSFDNPPDLPFTLHHPSVFLVDDCLLISQTRVAGMTPDDDVVTETYFDISHVSLLRPRPDSDKLYYVATPGPDYPQINEPIVELVWEVANPTGIVMRMFDKDGVQAMQLPNPLKVAYPGVDEQQAVRFVEALLIYRDIYCDGAD